MLLELGIDVSYETVHRWVKKFGPNITRNLRRRQPKPGDIWHLDEVAVKCGGEKLWLWRAVNQFGTVLEEILQKRRDKRQQKRMWLRVLSTGRIRVSIIGLRTATCPIENGNEPCSVTSLREHCSGSSPCIQQRAIVFRTLPPPSRPHNSLPSSRSFRDVEHCGI